MVPLLWIPAYAGMTYGSGLGPDTHGLGSIALQPGWPLITASWNVVRQHTNLL